jgi:hypothetical protein
MPTQEQPLWVVYRDASVAHAMASFYRAYGMDIPATAKALIERIPQPTSAVSSPGPLRHDPWQLGAPV